MEQNALTVIVPIKSQAVEALREILTEINKDIDNNPHLHFRKSPSTHFARWVILDRNLDTDPKFPRLMFTSNYDGSFESYMRELVENLGSGMEQIWNKCEGYSPGTAQDSASFLAFIKQHAVESQAFYVACRGATVKTILCSMQLREMIDQLLDGQECESWFTQVASLVPFVSQPHDLSVSDTQTQAKASFGQSLRSPIEKVIEWLVGVRPVRNPNKRVEVRPDLSEIEDRDEMVQNQMTIIVGIKPQLLSHLLLKLVLRLISRGARKAKGSLSGITTIHFARWVIIDDGKNLLFESNFDGSWENYIDDFVDQASVRMNMIWGNCVNFPTGGCQDIEWFKQHIRNYQVPAQFFYSAYPNATVKNNLNDLQLSQAVAQFLQQKEVTRFLTGSYNSPL